MCKTCTCAKSLQTWCLPRGNRYHQNIRYIVPKRPLPGRGVNLICLFIYPPDGFEPTLDPLTEHSGCLLRTAWHKARYAGAKMQAPQAGLAASRARYC